MDVRTRAGLRAGISVLGVACLAGGLIGALAGGLPASADPTTAPSSTAGPAGPAAPAGTVARPNALGMSPNAGAIPAQIMANESTAYYYFTAHGLTGIQSAGIIGNLDVESGMDPNAVQSGGPGRGTAQWSVGGRWDTDALDNMVWYANQHSASRWDLSAQLDFIWYELTTISRYGLAQLRNATTITAAVTVFQDDFEGCGACNTSNRISYAQAAYQRYGSSGRLASAGGTDVALNTGEMDYFYRSAAGHLMQHAYRTAGGWQPAQDLGAPTSGFTWDPDAASWGNGSMDVVGRDNSAHLVLRSYAGGSWSGWQVFTDTSMLSSPSIVDTAVGQRDVFWMGANHQLLRRNWVSGRGWSSVAAVPGVSNIASGPDAVTWQVGSGHIDVVYRSTAGTLWSVTYDHGWRAPVQVNATRSFPWPMATVDPGSGTTGPGDFSVYATSTGGTIYHASGNTLTGVWTPWYAISGSPDVTASPDTATLPGTGVFVVTASAGNMVTSWYVNHAWASWQSV